MGHADAPTQGRHIDRETPGWLLADVTIRAGYGSGSMSWNLP
jgi:hypothetical protein